MSARVSQKLAQDVRDRIVRMLDDALMKGQPEEVASMAMAAGKQFLDACPKMRELALTIEAGDLGNVSELLRVPA